jgi:hypothetical protein
MSYYNFPNTLLDLQLSDQSLVHSKHSGRTTVEVTSGCGRRWGKAGVGGRGKRSATETMPPWHHASAMMMIQILTRWWSRFLLMYYNLNDIVLQTYSIINTSINILNDSSWCTNARLPCLWQNCIWFRHKTIGSGFKLREGLAQCQEMGALNWLTQSLESHKWILGTVGNLRWPWPQIVLWRNHIPFCHWAWQSCARLFCPAAKQYMIPSH